MNKLHWKKVL